MKSKSLKAKDAPPKTALARTKKLISLAAHVGQKEASQRISNILSENNPLKRLQHQIDQTRLLVETLGQLKGAAMKVGQLLSLEAGDFFPPEVVEILSKLQDGGSAMGEETVREILRQELGAERVDQLQLFSPTPCASASIGQVHTARCAEGQVAVKIQFPGIADTIDSDIRMLRKLVSTFFSLTGRQIDLDALFDELSGVLSQETNYENEAAQIEIFRALLADCPAYVVPRARMELTTRRVLVMSFEEGLKFKDWLRTDPPRELREHYGHLILDLYVKEFFENGVVQTDPNFANFLFRPETRQLVILDFGAVRRYTPKFRADYRELLKIIRAGEHRRIVDHAVGMDLIKAFESDECFAAFVEMLRVSVAPFDADKQPFDFSDVDYTKQVREATMCFSSKVRHSAPPHQLIFLHRKLGGIFTLLKQMRARIDLDAYWRRIIEGVPGEVPT